MDLLEVTIPEQSQFLKCAVQRINFSSEGAPLCSNSTGKKKLPGLQNQN